MPRSFFTVASGSPLPDQTVGHIGEVHNLPFRRGHLQYASDRPQGPGSQAAWQRSPAPLSASLAGLLASEPGVPGPVQLMYLAVLIQVQNVVGVLVLE